MSADGHPVDERERLVLERGLRELGYNPDEFRIEIQALAVNPRERSLPRGTFPRRKLIIVTRLPAGDTFEHEAYIDNPWAGEVVLAVVNGRFGLPE